MRSSTPVARLWLAVLCGYLALGATLQELPTYLSSRFHAGTLLVGVTVGIAYAGTAAGRPFAGRLGDAGRSRVTALCGCLLTAAAGAGHLLAPDIGALLVARVVMGLGEAALFSGTLPWVLAGVPPERGGRVAGWFGLSMWGGLSAGPLLATGLHAAGGSTAVWLTVIGLPVMSGMLIASTRAPATPGGRFTMPGLRELLPPGAGTPGLIIGMSSYGYGTLTALLVLFLERGRIGGQAAGLAVFSAVFLLTRAAGSPLVDRYSGRSVVRCVLIVEAAGLALLAMAGSEPAALASVAVTGAGLGLVYPAVTRITLDRVDRRATGAAVGAMTSCWDLGVLAAGPVGGLISGGPGFRTAFTVAAVLALASLAVVSFLAARSLPATPNKAESPESSSSMT
jgi:MFS family permease